MKMCIKDVSMYDGHSIKVCRYTSSQETVSRNWHLWPPKEMVKGIERIRFDCMKVVVLGSGDVFVRGVLEHNITPAHGDAAAPDDFKIYFGCTLHIINITL